MYVHTYIQTRHKTSPTRFTFTRTQTDTAQVLFIYRHRNTHTQKLLLKNYNLPYNCDHYCYPSEKAFLIQVIRVPMGLSMRCIQ